MPGVSGTPTAITTPPTGDDAEEAALKKAKEHLPWFSEEKLKQLISTGIGIEQMERGRSAISNDLSLLKGSLGDYKKAMGVYPEGGNTDVAKALAGENPAKAVFLEWPRLRISTSGELSDPWGTPYYIHINGAAIAGKEIEIRSAGSNRLFWDEDDRVMK